jgi:branched-subunit amino acid transport protein
VTPYLVVLAVGLGSYAFRVSILVLAARAGIPPVVERAARHAVPVSFAALATSALVDRVATADLAVPSIAAVIAAVGAVHRTGRPFAAIAVGMPTLWLLTALSSA